MGWKGDMGVSIMYYIYECWSNILYGFSNRYLDDGIEVDIVYVTIEVLDFDKVCNDQTKYVLLILVKTYNAKFHIYFY